MLRAASAFRAWQYATHTDSACERREAESTTPHSLHVGDVPGESTSISSPAL